ncbi:MAG: hypothetical protein ABEH77_02910 [Halobacteriaceae archaeon]
MSDWLSRFAFEVALFRYDPREWVVMTGDRLLVSLLQVGALVGVLLAVMLSGLVPLAEETPVLFLLFALIAANFTLIAIVTSLGQFVLSQRLESPGEIRTKIGDTISYREDIGGTIGQPILPVKPDAFFLLLFETARDDLASLEGLTSEGRTKRTRDELEELVRGLQSHTGRVIGLLEHPASEMKHALFVSLDTNYENHVHRAWYLQREYSDEFTDRVTDQLDRLADTLEHIVVANRMFGATFIESEVSELVRYLLYVGLPVQVTAIVVMLLYTAPGATPLPSRQVMAVLVPAVLVAGFTPFLILSSYIVRLSVVARRTADSFPFSSQLRQTVALRDAFVEERD